MQNQVNHTLDQGAPNLAPGDEVARYVDGQPIFCTIVEVVNEDQVIIEAELWPAGYTALVRRQDVSLVSRKA